MVKVLVQVINWPLALALTFVFALYFYGFVILLRGIALSKGKCSAVESDVDRRSRELKLPMRKRWQRV